MGVRNVPESAPHAQSSGTDANRHRVIARDARVWWTWGLAALGRDDTPGDAVQLPMRRLLGQSASTDDDVAYCIRVHSAVPGSTPEVLTCPSPCQPYLQKQT